jgi:hypothetical protein
VAPHPQQAPFPPEQPVHVTELAGTERPLAAQVSDLHGHILDLLVNELLPARGLVKVESEEYMALGETCGARECASGFAVRLVLEHVLPKNVNWAPWGASRKKARSPAAGWKVHYPPENEVLDSEPLLENAGRKV